MKPDTYNALMKFKLASDFHKRIRGNKDKDDNGRTLTFLRIPQMDLEITWKDLELIGELVNDSSKNDTPV